MHSNQISPDVHAARVLGSIQSDLEQRIRQIHSERTTLTGTGTVGPGSGRALIRAEADGAIDALNWALSVVAGYRNRLLDAEAASRHEAAQGGAGR